MAIDPVYLHNHLLNLLIASASTTSCDTKVQHFTTCCTTTLYLLYVVKEAPTCVTKSPLVPKQWDLVHGNSPSTLPTASLIFALSASLPFPNGGVPDFFSLLER